MHAMWNKFRGRIIGNDRLIRKGERESQRLVSYKKALKDARNRKTSQRKARERVKGKKAVHLPLFNKRHYKTQYYSDGTVELHERHHPYLHYHHRTKHPHHGFRYRVTGFFTGNKSMRDKGKSMHDVARRERELARRRRRKELKSFGHAMRTKHRY